MVERRVAVWQGVSPAGDVHAGLAALRAPLRAAAAMGAAVLVVPEVWLPGYNQPDIAARADSGWPDAARALCREAGCGLVLGYAERAEGQLFNAAIVIGAEGQVLANYRKIQLYGARETALYTPGDAYVTFDLAGERAAVLICYDIEFAPHVAALAARGVTLVLVPTANMHPFTHVVRHTVPAMAANHGVTIAYANYCGSEGALDYVGGSLIAGPHGEVLAQAGDHPALLIADIPARDVTRISTQGADLRQI
jgi:5-aminopentanamidase